MSSPVTERSDYRQMLRAEWESRLARNARYSLRSFARDLRMTAPQLSEIFAGKRGLSREVALRVVGKLGWDTRTATRFCDLVEAAHARSPLARHLAEHRLEKDALLDDSARVLSQDAYRTVSDWYHFAILAALKLPEVRGSSTELALRLDLAPLVIEEALKRLERLALVRRKAKRWEVLQNAVFSTDGIPSDAIRQSHEQLLNRAVEALHLQPVTERNFYAYILPICGGDLPEIAARYEQFVLGIRDEFSTRPTVDRVVNIGNQIFGLTRAVAG